LRWFAAVPVEPRFTRPIIPCVLALSMRCP
jgi:hypothetical protein